MIIYRVGCLEFQRLELQPTSKAEFPPSSTTAEHNCGFSTSQEKTTLQTETARES